jgi:hypothetical protein
VHIVAYPSMFAVSSALFSTSAQRKNPDFMLKYGLIIKSMFKTGFSLQSVSFANISQTALVLNFKSHLLKSKNMCRIIFN